MSITRRAFNTMVTGSAAAIAFASRATAAAVAAIMDNWPCHTLRVADRGLREGMLIALVRESESPARTSARAN